MYNDTAIQHDTMYRMYHHPSDWLYRVSKRGRAEEQAHSHQVDADGEHGGSGWKVDGGQLFPGHNYGAALACAQTTPGALASSFEPPSYLPSLTTITVRAPRSLQQLLSSLFRRARAAGLLLRLPASQPEQATAGSAAAGHAGGQEATCRGRS